MVSSNIRYMPEPISAIFFFGVTLCSPVYEQYFYKRYSEAYGYNWTLGMSTTGLQNNSTDDTLKEVQDAVSKLLTRNTYCLTIPSIIVGLIYGPLTDRIGRKPILLINILSFLIYSGLMVFIEIFHANILFVYLGAAIYGSGGYISVYTTIVMSYLSDIVQKDRLPLRIGIIQAIVFVALAISNYISGYFLKAFDFLATFILISSLAAIALLMCIFQLAESLPKENRAERGSSLFTLPRQVWKFLMATRPKKWRLYFLIPIDGLSYFNSQPVLAPILLLRLLNKPFWWSTEEIGVYRGTFFLVTGVFSAVLVGVLPKLLHRSSVLFIGFISVGGSMALLGFAESTTAVYVSLVAGMFSYAASPMTRGILSNNVSPVEKGSLFALVGTLQTVIELIGTTLYQYFYRIGNDRGNPGEVFLFASLLTCLPILIVIIYSIKEIRDERKERKENDENGSIDGILDGENKPLLVAVQ